MRSRSTAAVGLAAAGLASLLSSSSLGEVTFEWAPIANTGNNPDPATGFGSVAYEYEIAATLVTNAQYAEFLNSVATNADPLGLYNLQMGGNPRAGIRVAISGSTWTFTAIPGREHKPVVFVSFLDAMRFVNWLHNGQGNGDTETGVYSVSDGVSETRAADARFFLLTEDEWYKAAYHQPADAGGDADGYWTYATGSNTAPVPGVEANYDGVINNTVDVNDLGANPNGVFNIAGNVNELCESLYSDIRRVVRGGNWGSDMFSLRATFRFTNFLPVSETDYAGFRVARAVVGAAKCPGDTNGDSIVNFTDLNTVLAQFGQSGVGLPGDVNGDEIVNFADLNKVLANFGAECD